MFFYEPQRPGGVTPYQEMLIHRLGYASVTLLAALIDEKVLVVIAVGNAEELVEALIPGHVFVPVTKVPLADHARCVAGILEDFRNGYFRRRQTFRRIVEQDRIHTGTQRVAAGQECRAGGRARVGRHIELPKLHPLRREPVNVRCADIRCAIGREIPT